MDTSKIATEHDEKQAEKSAEDAAKKAAARALIHEHAFQFVLASFHLGTPRLKAWTALRLAASIAAIANSQEIENVALAALANPQQQLQSVTADVRSDEELRQKDQVAVTTQESNVIKPRLDAIQDEIAELISPTR